MNSSEVHMNLYFFLVKNPDCSTAEKSGFYLQIHLLKKQFEEPTESHRGYIFDGSNVIKSHNIILMNYCINSLHFRRFSFGKDGDILHFYQLLPLKITPNQLHLYITKSLISSPTTLSKNHLQSILKITNHTIKSLKILRITKR